MTSPTACESTRRGWRILAGLRGAGILVSTAGPQQKYRYAPNSEHLRETIDQLAKSYLSHRVRITALIFAKPSDALQSFADAFRIRKDRSDG